MFNKKQIKSLLKSMKKSSERPALQSIRVLKDGYLYYTDGYIAIRWPVMNSGNYEELYADFSILDRWQKLASNKDIFSIKGLQSITSETPIYPDVNKLFEKLEALENSKDIKFSSLLLQDISNITDYYNWKITPCVDGRLYLSPIDKHLAFECILMSIV